MVTPISIQIFIKINFLSTRHDPGHDRWQLCWDIFESQVNLIR